MLYLRGLHAVATAVDTGAVKLVGGGEELVVVAGAAVFVVLLIMVATVTTATLGATIAVTATRPLLQLREKT